MKPCATHPTIRICCSTRRSGNARRDAPAKCRNRQALLRTVAECAKGLDFVGFYAGGTIVRGFASTQGSRGWYEVSNFNFSWSLYDPSGRAIKTSLCGRSLERRCLCAQDRAGRCTLLPVLAKTPRVLSPGRYRSYLAPAALEELLAMTAWSGFSARAQATSRSELYKLHAGEIALDPRVTLS